MIQEFLSVIVPCYNEDVLIEETHQRLMGVLTTHFSRYEIIYVNDGSSDLTLTKLNQLSMDNSNVKVVSFSRNFGHQPAVSAGISNCNGDVAIIIDADLQDPPELFPEIIDVWKKNACNVVYCVRKERLGETIFKKLTAKIFYRILNRLSDIHIPVDTGDFRLIDASVIQAFKRIPESNKYIRGIFSWLGFKHVPFYYVRQERFAGTTKYPLFKMLRFSTNGIMYFSKKPLEIMTFFGMSLLFFDLIFAGYVIYLKLTGVTIKGWTSLVLIHIFLSGVNLICLGIIGKYIGIIFDEVKRRPEYIIQSRKNF